MTAEARKMNRHGDTASPRLRRNLRLAGVAAIILAVGAAAIGIVGRHRNETQVRQWTEKEATPTVSTVTPQRGPATRTLILPGTIQAWYEAPIYARVDGYLKNWYYDYGAQVKKGALLAEIDTPDLDAALAAAKGRLNSAKSVVGVRQAQMEFAKTTYDRWRGSPRGVVSIQELESKKADYRSAVADLTAAIANVTADQGNVDRLEALEGFKRIIAPFDGIVTARETDIGALINAGSGHGPELFRVADVHEMRIYVDVPQQMSAGVKSGLPATLHLPQYPRKTFTATVATTSQAIQQASRTLLVELHADNPVGELQVGSYAEVHFHLEAGADVLRIPTSALLFRKGGLKVAVLGPDNKVELRHVELGRDLGTNVDVLSGISPTDRVINHPPDSLAEGEIVNVTGESHPPPD